jgi:hypothetical protein
MRDLGILVMRKKHWTELHGTIVPHTYSEVITGGSMTTLTDDAIGEVLTGILRRAEAEYQTMTQADLEHRWYFQYNPDRSIAWNIYSFHGCLALYGGSCRRWEEIHNGSECVVERVRDKYLMPKIKAFEQLLRSQLS